MVSFDWATATLAHYGDNLACSFDVTWLHNQPLSLLADRMIPWADHGSAYGPWRLTTFELLDFSVVFLVINRDVS